MARPKKDKTEEVVLEAALPEDPVTVVVAPVENKSAFSLFKNPATNKWTVVMVPFDLASGKAGTPVVLSEKDDRNTAMEQFKITVAKNFFA